MLGLTKDLSFLELFIINTITYFDLFDYPVTLTELQDFIFTNGMASQKFKLVEIKQILDKSLKLKKIISTDQGFYFLQGRQDIIDKRLNRYNISNLKFKIVLKAVRFFKYVPFIRLVAVCNNLAYWNAKQTSDLDLFIITAPNRIWQTRLFLLLLTSLLRLRPPKEKVQDKLCLSFYITEENLDLSDIKISAEDVYLVYWLATLWPIYDRGEYYQKLITINEHWLKQNLPNWQIRQPNKQHRIIDNKFSSYIYKFREWVLGGWLGNIVENFAKWLQLKKMSQKKKDMAINDDTRVIITDKMLKFHENDRRLEFLEKFEKKRKQLIDQI
ncbi:hypothetical protein ACFL2U_03585 [Patescibacteria group bacterium]